MRKEALASLRPVIKKLNEYKKGLEIENRSNDIRRRIRFYFSPDNAKKNLNQAMTLYKELFLDKRGLMDKDFYKFFFRHKNNLDDASDLYREILEIYTHRFNMLGPQDEKTADLFRKKLKQYTEDVVISYLFYHFGPKDEVSLASGIKMITSALESRSHRKIKEIEKDEQLSLIFYISEALHKNFTYFPYKPELIKRKTRKALFNIYRSIDDLDVKKALLKKFTEFRAPKKPRPSVKNQDKKPAPTQTNLKEKPGDQEIKKKRIQTLQEMQKSIEKQYQARNLIFETLPFIYLQDFPDRLFKVLREIYQPMILKRSRVKKIALAMKDVYAQIDREKIDPKLLQALNSHLSKYNNFQSIDKKLTSFLFANYRKQFKNPKSVEFSNFIRLPGIKDIVSALRRSLFLTLAKQDLKKQEEKAIYPSNEISLSSQLLQDVLDIRSNTKLFFPEKAKDLALLSDDKIAANLALFALNKHILENRLLDKLKIVKKAGQLFFEDEDFGCLLPDKTERYIESNGIRFPIYADLYDNGNDYYSIRVFSGNQLITIIPIEKIEYQ